MALTCFAFYLFAHSLRARRPIRSFVMFWFVLLVYQGMSYKYYHHVLSFFVMFLIDILRLVVLDTYRFFLYTATISCSVLASVQLDDIWKVLSHHTDRLVSKMDSRAMFLLLESVSSAFSL